MASIENGYVPGVKEFYNSVLRNASNFLSTRNKFKISWTSFDPGYKPLCSAGTDYMQINNFILRTLEQFRMYTDSIHVPGLSISSGGTIDEGMGTYYYSGNSMVQPEENKISVYFKEAQVSIVDLANVWMEFNGRPWVRPIRVNLNIDYYSDVDGKTPIMAYQMSGCAPMEIDTIEAKHEGKEIALRKIEFGFNSIKPRSVSGGEVGSHTVFQNWGAATAVTLDSYVKPI